MIGADGYRSVVRHYVAAERRHAEYAGYVVWLGQSDVPEKWQPHLRGVDFFSHENELLAVYPLIDRSLDLTRFGWCRWALNSPWKWAPKIPFLAPLLEAAGPAPQPQAFHLSSR